MRIRTSQVWKTSLCIASLTALLSGPAILRAEEGNGGKSGETKPTVQPAFDVNKPATPPPPTSAAPAPISITPTPEEAALPHKAGDMTSAIRTVDVPGGEKLDVEIGTLFVPENRSDPKCRVIGIAFARIKAAKPTENPPTFHLPGGPGGSYIGMMLHNPAPFLRFREAGDIVIIDQRGFSQRGDILKYHFTTEAEPLDKPASLARATEAFMKISKDAVADCEKKGVDLRGYTVKECAEDVNDLRKALGYKQITLVGISYGSQWSFATMRLHPEIVARALLSGVEPLNMGFDMPSGVYGAMQRYFKEAEKDRQLKPYIPAEGLDAAVRVIYERFKKGPIDVKVKDKDGEVTVTLGLEDFQGELLHTSQDGPAWVLAAYYEHYDAWARNTLAERRSHGQDMRIIGPCIDTSLAVTPARLKELKADPITALIGEWNWTAYMAAADIWPSPDVGDDFRTPVVTNIPVVFAQGDWDTKTPFENTTEIAKSFPHSRVVIAQHGGHGVLEPMAQHCPKEWAQIMDFVVTGNLPELPATVSLPMPKFMVPNFPAPKPAGEAETPVRGDGANAPKPPIEVEAPK